MQYFLLGILPGSKLSRVIEARQRGCAMLGTITLLGVILLVLVIFVCPLILFACCVSEDKRRKEEANGHVVPDLVDHRTS